MTFFEWYWLVVSLVVLFLLFLPVEIMAYRDGKPGGTLSETVWKYIVYPEKTSRGYRYRRLMRIGLAVGLGWLSVHFLSGGWI